MEQDKLDKINKLIDNLRVVDYNIYDVNSDTSFLKFKRGIYKLNNGETIERESVVKASSLCDATAIFAITDSKEILLVIQPRAALPTDSKVDIELPAGYIEKDEDVLDAAIRELKEETGYVPKEVSIIDEYYPSLGYCGEKIYIILAIGCIKKYQQHLDKDEFVSYIKVSIDEFRYLLDNNYIMDATARLAYYRTIEYLTNNDMLSMIGDKYEGKEEKNKKES